MPEQLTGRIVKFETRKGAGVAEPARLESVCTPKVYRGFCRRHPMENPTLGELKLSFEILIIN
jgi:hypothetical protein